MSHLQTLVAAGAVAGAVLSIVALAVLVGRPLRRLLQQNEQFREDWYGEPARPGRDAVPGVPARLKAIEKELKPNGGSSMRDAIGRVEQRLAAVETRLDDHVRSHVGADR